jgi:hypothetical protein
VFFQKNRFCTSTFFLLKRSSTKKHLEVVDFFLRDQKKIIFSFQKLLLLKVDVFFE